MPGTEDEKASANRTVSGVYSDVENSLFPWLPQESFSEPNHVQLFFEVVSQDDSTKVTYHWNNCIKTHNHPFLCLLAMAYGTTHRPSMMHIVWCPEYGPCWIAAQPPIFDFTIMVPLTIILMLTQQLSTTYTKDIDNNIDNVKQFVGYGCGISPL